MDTEWVGLQDLKCALSPENTYWVLESMLNRVLSQDSSLHCACPFPSLPTATTPRTKLRDFGIGLGEWRIVFPEILIVLSILG